MCSPCRASVLTGLMPSQHGVHTWIDGYYKDNWPDNWNAIEEFDTLPEKLSREGYDTALFGKFHLGNAESATNIFNKSPIIYGEKVAKVSRILVFNRYAIYVAPDI